MQYKKNHYDCGEIPMINLQLFAEEDGGGSHGGYENGTGAEADSVGRDRSKMFDNFLKQGENQAEFDRRVQKAIQTAVKNEKKKWESLPERGVAECSAAPALRRCRVNLEYEIEGENYEENGITVICRSYSGEENCLSVQN